MDAIAELVATSSTGTPGQYSCTGRSFRLPEAPAAPVRTVLHIPVLDSCSQHQRHLCCARRAISLGQVAKNTDPALPSASLTCPEGATLQIGSLDAAQNPLCVRCGHEAGFCCSESFTVHTPLHSGNADAARNACTDSA